MTVYARLPRLPRFGGQLLYVLFSLSPVVWLSLEGLFGILVRLLAIPWRGNGAPMPPGMGWQLIPLGIDAAMLGMVAWLPATMLLAGLGGWRWPGFKWCVIGFLVGVGLLFLSNSLNWFVPESYWLFG